MLRVRLRFGLGAQRQSNRVDGVQDLRSRRCARHRERGLVRRGHRLRSFSIIIIIRLAGCHLTCSLALKSKKPLEYGRSFGFSSPSSSFLSPSPSGSGASSPPSLPCGSGAFWGVANELGTGFSTCVGTWDVVVAGVLGGNDDALGVELMLGPPLVEAAMPGSRRCLPI